MQDGGYIGVCDLLKCECATARQQGVLHFERRVLGGCSNQCDLSTLHGPQENILLILGEAVDLVTEDDRLSSRESQFIACLGEDLLTFADT